MTDLDRALADITTMRRQLARGTQFRGFGPAALATTGILALAGGAAQAAYVPNPGGDITAYLALWVAIAITSVLIIGIEAIRRSRVAHTGLADDMLMAAAEQFLPAAIGAALITAILKATAPETLWMLPGLWQVILGLGIWAACASLPRPLMLVAGWYMAAGLVTLAYAQGAHALSPLAMALPFGIGQILAAILFKLSSGGGDGQG
jgi:hypothetical protein